MYSKLRLFKELSRPCSVEEDIELLRQVVEEVSAKFDPDLIDAAEQAFGFPYYQLVEFARGQHPEARDFIKAVKLHSAWLGSYLRLTEANEGPGHFHALSALACIGAALGTSVWLDMGFYRIYPPMAVLLTGPSGIRKSVVLAAASNLLTPFVDRGLIAVFRDRFTIEGIISNVTSGSRVLLMASELAATFGKARYLEDSIPLITRMLDQEGIDYTTKTAGRFSIKDVAFGLLGASTMDWLLNEIPNSAATGGFLGRFLIPYARTTTRYVYRAEDVSAKIAGLGEMALDASSSVSGKVKLSTEADRWAERWYKSSRGDLDESFMSAAMGSYYNRRLTHLLRIALILAVLDKSQRVELPHVLDAYAILSYIEPGHLNVLTEVAGSMTHRDMVTLAAELSPRGTPAERAVHIGVLLMGSKRYKEAMAYAIRTGVVKMDGGRYYLTLKNAPPMLRKVIMAKREAHDDPA